MSAKLAPIVNNQWQLADGLPAVGNQFFFYISGSSTKTNIYSDAAGSTPIANPVVLNALGMPPDVVYLEDGVSYKIRYCSSTEPDPPATSIEDWDPVVGIAGTAADSSEWTAFGSAPTFISTTSFSVPGDQTGTFEVGRRVKTTNTGGTIYSRISASAFASVTTVTVVNDSGVLDSGLSAVSYGMLSATNASVPNFAGPSSNSPSPAGQIVIRGGQIAFPGTQVPSTDVNTLDDYEEGTWTAGITYATPGDQNIVIGTNVCSYTKIGRQVTISGTLITTTHTFTTASGSLQITGAPFTSKTASNYFALGPLIHAGLTVTGASITTVRIPSNSTIMTVVLSSGGPSNLGVAAAGTNTTSATNLTLEFTLSYEAAA